jgi:hypothetical protein
VNGKITIIDEATQGAFLQSVNTEKLQYAEKTDLKKSHAFLFHVQSSFLLKNQSAFSGVIILKCEGFVHNKPHYQHTLSIPNRSADAIDYVKCAIAWQLGKFIKLCEEKCQEI